MGLNSKIAPTKKTLGQKSPELGLASTRLVLPGGALTRGADGGLFTVWRWPVRVLPKMPLTKTHHRCQECGYLQAADFRDGYIA